MSCKAIPDPAEWAARFSGLIVRQQDPSGSFLDQGLTSRQGQDGKRGGTQRANATARASRRKPSRTTQCPRSRRIGARPSAAGRPLPASTRQATPTAAKSTPRTRPSGRATSGSRTRSVDRKGVGQGKKWENE